MYVFYAAFAFISQFWAFEYVVAGRGVIDALKQSFNVVKNNALETISFNFLWMIVGGFLSIPVFGLALLIYVAPYLVPAILFNLGLDAIAILAITFVGFILWLLLMLVFGTIVSTFSLPTHYLYWTKARKRIKETS
jgi:hypothetical protein